MFDTAFAITVAGWSGAALLLASYALVSMRKLEASGTAFQIMNVAGSAALATNSASNGAWPSAILNIVWLAIGLATLISLARKIGRRMHVRPVPRDIAA